MPRNEQRSFIDHDSTNPGAYQQEEADEQIAAQTKAERDIADFLGVLSTPGGRRFMTRLLDETGLFASSFTGNSETFMREGKRKVGLWLWEQIQTNAPEIFVTMQKERNG